MNTIEEAKQFLRDHFDELMSGLPFNQETPSQSYDATEQVSLF